MLTAVSETGTSYARQSFVKNTGSYPQALSNIGNTSVAPYMGEFWAGATISWIPRDQDIPGRMFYDFDVKSVKDPYETLGDAGFNAFRTQASRGQCLGPTNWVNNESTLNDELLYRLDIGCPDIHVKLAQKARAAGMKCFVLTINQGLDISRDQESYSYEEMVEDVKKETKRRLEPFINGGVLPDVILLENEGTDGFPMIEESTGHTRGVSDGKASTEKVNQELCGQIPTGTMNSYPQLAGYY